MHLLILKIIFHNCLKTWTGYVKRGKSRLFPQNLLNRMKKERSLTYLFIAHDLSVVRFISDRVAVIYRGKLVELAECEELFSHPLHPYTRALLSAIPYPDPDRRLSGKLAVYDPSMHDYSVRKPRWEEIAPGHFVWGNDPELEAYRREL